MLLVSRVQASTAVLAAFVGFSTHSRRARNTCTHSAPFGLILADAHLTPSKSKLKSKQQKEMPRLGMGLKFGDLFCLVRGLKELKVTWKKTIQLQRGKIRTGAPTRLQNLTYWIKFSCQRFRFRHQVQKNTHKLIWGPFLYKSSCCVTKKRKGGALISHMLSLRT